MASTGGDASAGPSTPRRRARTRCVVRSPYFQKCRRASGDRSEDGGRPRAERDAEAVVTSCYFSSSAIHRGENLSLSLHSDGHGHEQGSSSSPAGLRTRGPPASLCPRSWRSPVPGTVVEFDDAVTRARDGSGRAQIPREECDCPALFRDSAFRNFCAVVVRAYEDVYHAKPMLIQEHVARDPWKVMVVSALLNKTAGRMAVPTFFRLVETWPTPCALAQACPDTLERLIKHLGFGKSRTARLIQLSQAYVQDPPNPDRSRQSRCYITVLTHSDLEEEPSIVRRRYSPTPASHLPGSGPYALDSYRIFCGGPDEWKTVLPTDKVLIRYLKWKWAVMEFLRWDHLTGPGRCVDVDYLLELAAELKT